jgi:hypothetical protein
VAMVFAAVGLFWAVLLLLPAAMHSLHGCPALPAPRLTCSGTRGPAGTPAFVPVRLGPLPVRDVLRGATERLTGSRPLGCEALLSSASASGSEGAARRPGTVLKIKRCYTRRAAVDPRRGTSACRPAFAHALLASASQRTERQEGKDKVATETEASASVDGIASDRGLVQARGHAHAIANAKNASRDADAVVDVLLLGDELSAKIAEVRRKLEHGPVKFGDEARIASGEVQSRQLWSSGPEELLKEMLRAAVLLVVVVRKTAVLVAQVVLLAFRTARWVLDWAISVGDAKEWWIPEAVDYAENVMTKARSSRTIAYARLLRAKLRALLVVVYHTVASSVSPTVVTAGEKWARELLVVVSEQTRGLLINTAPPSAQQPSESGARALQDKPQDSRSVASSSSGGGSVSSSSSYTTRLDKARERSTLRLTNSILGVDVSNAGQADVTVADLNGQGVDTKDGLDAAARGYVSLAPEAADFEQGSSTLARRLGSTRAPLRQGTRTRKRDATMQVVKNVTSSVGSTFERTVANLRGFSQTVNVSSLSAASYSMALEALSLPKDATVNASLALWSMAEGPFNQTGSWVSTVLSGKNADASAWVQGMEETVGPWRNQIMGWWSDVESGVGKWDSRLVRLVDKTEEALDRVFSTTVNSATALPVYQSAEQWIRGNEFSLGWYIKVQRWWHEWILFCTPKWEAFEAWARGAKVPEFARRVISNVIYYRLSYLRCLLGLAALEAIFWQKLSAVVLMITALLSAMVVRSNVLALSAVMSAREAAQEGSGFKGAAGMLKPLFGLDRAERQVEKQAKDKSQLAASVALFTLAWGILSPSNVVRNMLAIIVAHAFLHAKQVGAAAAPCTPRARALPSPPRPVAAFYACFRPEVE